MALGAFAPLPLRLGGSALEGLTAAQHARICADWLSLRRVMPFAEWSYDKSGSTITINNYRGQNGSGALHAPTATNRGTGITSFYWPDGMTFADPYGSSAPITIRMAIATANGSAAIKCTVLVTTSSDPVFVYSWNTAGAATDASVSVKIW